MADFRPHDSRPKKPKGVRDSYNPLLLRSKASIERELDRFFRVPLTKK